jgi:hypothetical protein
VVTTVSTNPAAAVAVVAIVVTVAARIIIVDRRGVPPCPVRIVADQFLRLIPPRRAPVSDYRERNNCDDCEARAENCPTTSVPSHIEHLTVEHLAENGVLKPSF